MQMSIGQKSVVGAFIALGVATLVFSVLMFINGIADGWLFTDIGDTVEGLALLAFMGGPFLAIAGVYAWRRADADDRSTKNARVMIVIGTLGIAGLGAFMYWTAVGPIIAIAIVVYWAYKIIRWRGDGPKTA